MPFTMYDTIDTYNSSYAKALKVKPIYSSHTPATPIELAVCTLYVKHMSLRSELTNMCQQQPAAGSSGFIAVRLLQPIISCVVHVSRWTSRCQRGPTLHSHHTVYGFSEPAHLHALSFTCMLFLPCTSKCTCLVDPVFPRGSLGL